MSSQQPVQGMFDRHHAVVIGGSMAGLLATRVLSDHFAQVTLIERARLTGDAEVRKGIPQGRHVHGWLARGAVIIGENMLQSIPEKGGSAGSHAICSRNRNFLLIEKQGEIEWMSSSYR